MVYSLHQGGLTDYSPTVSFYRTVVHRSASLLKCLVERHGYSIGLKHIHYKSDAVHIVVHYTCVTVVISLSHIGVHSTCGTVVVSLSQIHYSNCTRYIIQVINKNK